jgi:methionyl-tRNA formyltransferase
VQRSHIVLLGFIGPFREEGIVKILFMGRKLSSANLLEWSLNKGHEIVGVLTDSHLVNSPTAKMAKKYGIDIYSIEEIYEKIKNNQIEIDLAISVVYWKKIKEPLISFPKFGTINLHPAPLPDYKGTAGYNMAILDGLDEWAITAHYVNQYIDEGEIIKKFIFSIDPESETVTSLEKTSQIFIESLYKNIINLVSKGGILKSTKNSGGRYISREEMESMKKVREGDDVDLKIRAFWFPPYLGAYIYLNEKKYTLISNDILMSLAPKHETNLFAKKIDA